MVQQPEYEPHAILVADMVGYSRLLAQEPIATHTIFSAHLLGVFHPSVSSRAGRVVKTTGDGIVAVFTRADDAEACARDIQSKIESEPTEIPSIKYRICVHYGDIIIEPTDVFGIDVNIAIHMQALAPPGGVCISGNLYAQLEDTKKAPYKYLGRKYLKNIPRAIDTYYHTAGSPHASRGILEVLPASRRRSLAPAPRVGVACLHLHTPSESGKMLVRLAQDALLHGLARFRDIVAASPLTTEFALSYGEAGNLRETLSNELGLDYLVYGSCALSNETVAYTVHLEHLIRRELLWSNKFSLPAGQIEQIDDAISQQMIAPIALYVQRNEIETWFLGGHGPQSENELLFREAKSLIGQGSLKAIDRARGLLSKVLTSAGDVADVHIAAARAEHLYGRLLAGQQFVDSLERARDHARIAIDVDDLNAQAHAELALQEMFLKRQTTAAEIYQRALKLNPYDTMLQADWADCLTFMGRADEAQQILTKVAEGWPRDRTWVLWNLADAEWALNRPDRVIEILQNQPDLPHVPRNLAAAYAKLGRMTEAKHHAGKVRLHQPSFSTKEWSSVVPYTKTDTAEEFADYLAKAGL